jgi:hypothetical protein
MARKVKTSKFIRLYGCTLEELARQLKVSVYRAYIMHIEEQQKKGSLCEKCGRELQGETPALSGINNK